MNSEKFPGACYTFGSTIGRSGSEAETLNRNARKFYIQSAL